MQPYLLTVDKFLDHAAAWSPSREVVSAEGGSIGYAALRERSNRFSGALLSLGLAEGDRVATLAWNTPHHLESYYAVMGAGLVCHTLNPRLTAAQLADMIDEAQDRVLLAAATLRPLAQELLRLCPGLDHLVVLDEAADDLPEGAWTYEALLAERGAPTAWGGFDEEAPAGLCHTSGTTGRPKGVRYTHRSNHLHTLRALQADAMALSGADAVLAAVPMFHANGWGLPFAAPAVGAKLVLPGRRLDGGALASLMRREAVTVAVGVQTVWLGLVDHLDASGGELPALERVIVGGSRCSDALLARLETRLGARVQTSWGMTELSPVGTMEPLRGARGAGRRTSGLPAVGLDLRLTDGEGGLLPRQRGVEGRLQVRGASVVDRYLGAEAAAVDADGWFDTGDLAVIDENGLTVTGRSKELIKSGGEWINPAEIEHVVGRLPAVSQAAVIAREDARWGERPVLIVEPAPGSVVEAAEVLAALRGAVADWWLPDEVFAVERMPLAPTGKIDKNRLRADYVGGAFVA